MKNRPAFALVVVLAVLGVTAAWYSNRTQPARSDDGVQTQTRLEKTNMAKTAVANSSKITPAGIQGADAILSDLSQLARKQPSVSRTLAIMSKLTELLRVSPEFAISSLGGLATDPLYSEFCRHLTVEWVKLDKVSAVNYFVSLTNRDEGQGMTFLPYVFEALFDLKTSEYSDIASLVSQLGRQPSVMALFVNKASAHLVEDPKALDDLLKISDDDPQYRKELFRGAGTGLAINQGLGSLNEFNVSNLTPDRSAMLHGICAVLARAKPEELTRWFSEHSKSSELDPIRDATGKLLMQSRDPAGACKVVAGITDDSLRGAVVVEPLVAWLNRDFDSAYKWALESTVHEDTIAKAVSQVEKSILSTSNSKFESAIALNPNPADLSILSRKQFGVFVNWSNVDPLAAREWLARSSLSPQEKEKLLPITQR